MYFKKILDEVVSREYLTRPGNGWLFFDSIEDAEKHFNTIPKDEEIVVKLKPVKQIKE